LPTDTSWPVFVDRLLLGVTSTDLRLAQPQFAKDGAGYRANRRGLDRLYPHQSSLTK